MFLFFIAMSLSCIILQDSIQYDCHTDVLSAPFIQHFAIFFIGAFANTTWTSQLAIKYIFGLACHAMNMEINYTNNIFDEFVTFWFINRVNYEWVSVMCEAPGTLSLFKHILFRISSHRQLLFYYVYFLNSSIPMTLYLLVKM